MTSPLTHDWNRRDAPGPAPPSVRLLDGTLRDGLQAPSVRTPTPEEKIDILARMDALAIDAADIGLPGAGGKAASDVERLVKAIGSARLKLRPVCAARAIASDVTSVAEIAQRTGVSIECAIFVGSGPIRRLTAGESVEQLQRGAEAALALAVKEGLAATCVSEDTTRCEPDALRPLLTAAVRAGASRVCITDSAGQATPAGAAAIVGFVRSLLIDLGSDAAIDWHGHDDRGFALASSLAALEAGATRLHGSALGIGERAGNAPIELLLVNLVMMGYRSQDLTRLGAYCEAVARACEVPIPARYPVVGAEAFRTSAGAHAAAVLKAFREGDRALADAAYTAVPPSLVGRQAEVEIGPMSGRANVVYWFESRGVRATDAMVERVVAAAKASNRTLTEEQIRSILDRKI